MCGRYLRKSDKQKIAEEFRARNDLSDISMAPQDLNVTPYSKQPVIRESKDEGTRELVLMQWALVPFYTTDLNNLKGRTTFIARSESVATSPMWKEPFKKRRCLVPASGFYEWQPLDKKVKKPYTLTLSHDSLFAFAGLWDAWKAPDGRWLQSFSLITTDANELMSSIHTRMPVILHGRDYDRWLSREVTEQLPLDLLRPYESEDMQMVEGGPTVPDSRKGPMAFHPG